MIVVNYRRSDAAGYALFVHSELSRKFHPKRVFLDVGGELSTTQDFNKAIFFQIQHSRVVLCLIGPNWLTAMSQGRYRLSDTDDLVRRELDYAFQQRKTVIPVLLNDAKMPRHYELPSSISELSSCNAEFLRHETAYADVTALIAALQRVLRPANASSQEVTATGWTPQSLNNLEKLINSLPAANSLSARSPSHRNSPIALNSLFGAPPVPDDPLLALYDRMKRY